MVHKKTICLYFVLFLGAPAFAQQDKNVDVQVGQESTHDATLSKKERLFDVESLKGKSKTSILIFVLEQFKRKGMDNIQSIKLKENKLKLKSYDKGEKQTLYVSLSTGRMIEKESKSDKGTNKKKKEDNHDTD